MDTRQFIQAVLKQDENVIRSCFHDYAQVFWHCTNEQFTVEEYIQANCQYPGKWDGEIERIEEVNGLNIVATHVYSVDHEQSFHAVSFIRIKDDKIEQLDEYWADDGAAPQWRVDMCIGKPIR